MNQRSTNRSFDAAMRLFQTRQRLEGGGVGENEGDGSPLGGIGGLALSAGFGLHGLELDEAEARGLVGGNGHRVVGRVAVGLEVGAISGNVGQAADLGEGGFGGGQHFGQKRLVTRESGNGGLAGVPDFGGRVAVHGSTLHQLAEFGGDADSQRVGVAGVGHSAFRREAAELAGLCVSGLDSDLAEVGGGSAVAGGDAVNVNLAAGHGDHAGSDLCGGEGGVHGVLQTGPIPAMSNPKPVTSDVSSPFGKRIMNKPIPYQLTPEGRAIAAAYKKRQEEGNGHG